MSSPPGWPFFKLTPKVFQMDLLVDGNLAQTFGPDCAALYFARLLRVDVRSLRPTMSQEWPHAFFTTSPTVHNASPSLLIDGRPAWLLDYTIRDVGTVVPQRLWLQALGRNNSLFTNVSLNMPIFFVGEDRVSLGLPLPMAITDGDLAPPLRGAGSAAPVGIGSTAYIRISWPGYSDWSTQIMTRDQTPAHNTISLKKFAKRMASAVGRFLDEAERLSSQEPNWRVGGGGITKEQVILIGAVHVSQGSWQPILQLDRFVVPRSSTPWTAVVVS